eukprot:scaffold986_cov237-Pinguiococcus_pyrenoidosus.AAC.31
MAEENAVPADTNPGEDAQPENNNAITIRVRASVATRLRLRIRRRSDSPESPGSPSQLVSACFAGEGPVWRGDVL